MEGKELKRCSTSTDAEADHGALSKGTKSLQKDERELENLVTKANPKKKQKTHKETSENKQIEDVSLEPKLKLKKTSEMKEMQKLRKSFKEMTEAVKKLQESLLIKADLPVISFKEIETPKKEELAEYECCFETKDSERLNGRNTIFVKGFDASLPRSDIRSALWEHFSSCGVVTRVFVPIECKTGASIGFAFIDFQIDSENALTLRDSILGGWRLQVMMARHTLEFQTWSNSFEGCKKCSRITMERIRRMQASRHGPVIYRHL